MSDDFLETVTQAGTGRVTPRSWDGEGDTVFGAPWQAQVFSMTVALNEAGIFTWKEWVDVFSSLRRASHVAGKPDTIETYYQDWLDALEAMSVKQGLASEEDQLRYREAWREAAERTRHGQPIELQDADFRETGHVCAEGAV